MSEFNKLQFDPNELKNQLEQNLGAKLTITTNGNSKKEQYDRDEFIDFVTNLDMFLVNQNIITEDFGLNLTEFLVPLHDVNLYLMIKVFGELGADIILQFIENRDAVSAKTPMSFVKDNIRYEITDLEDLYLTMKMLQNTLTKKPSGRKRT